MAKLLGAFQLDNMYCWYNLTRKDVLVMFLTYYHDLPEKPHLMVIDKTGTSVTAHIMPQVACCGQEVSYHQLVRQVMDRDLETERGRETEIQRERERETESLSDRDTPFCQ